MFFIIIIVIMNNNLILLSFADKRYKNALQQLCKLTQSFPFTERHFYNEDDLPKEYLSTLRYKIHRRGFGYWRWKSFLVKTQMDNMNEGDILVYSDAGVYWNVQGLSRFCDYLNMLRHSDAFILNFQQPYLEKDYSKGDILDYLGVYDNEKITMSLQLWGGIFMIKKNTESTMFVNKWYDICHNNYDLITDKKSQIPNLPGFIENRHDQSSFSLLAKQYPHIEISYKECQSINRNWDSLVEYPIQGRRDNNRLLSLNDKIKRKMSIPYKRVIGLYLRYFENMYFAVNPNW